MTAIRSLRSSTKGLLSSSIHALTLSKSSINLSDKSEKMVNSDQAHPISKPSKDEIVRKYNVEKNFTMKLSSKKTWESQTNVRATLNGIKTDKLTGVGVFGPRTSYSEARGIYIPMFLRNWKMR